MNDDELRSTLRRHDPAAGKMLEASERILILQRTERTHALRMYRGFALAALMLAILGGVMIAARREAKAPQPPDAALQIQYATPGGTRVVWTLDPNFHL
jgi:hypothetical protein